MRLGGGGRGDGVGGGQLKPRSPVCLIAIISSSGMTSPLSTSGIKDSNRWADFIFSPLSS